MATSLLLPDSSFYITCARQNIDPFTEADATVLTPDVHFKKIPGLRVTDSLAPPSA